MLGFGGSGRIRLPFEGPAAGFEDPAGLLDVDVLLDVGIEEGFSITSMSESSESVAGSNNGARFVAVSGGGNSSNSGGRSWFSTV
jgi:hypothetical protein